MARPPMRVLAMRWLLVVGSFALLIVGITSMVLAATKPEAQSQPAKGTKTQQQKPASQSQEPIDVKNAVECAAKDLRITAATDKNTYGPAQLPKFTIAVENLGAQPCKKNLGTRQMMFEVQDESQPVWNSRDCQQNPKDLVVVLRPGQKLVTDPLEWQRTASAQTGCDQEREEVPAGGAVYHLLVAVGRVPGVESVQFVLH